MRDFVNVAIEMARINAPDVLLLQQVNRSSARLLRKRFTKRTGSRYMIVEGPEKMKNPQPGVPVRGTVAGGYIRRDDSAILVNTATVRVISSGRVRVVQRRHAASHSPMQQVVPWARIIEKKEDPERLEMATTSIHYLTHGAFKNRRLSYRHKTRWSNQLRRFLGSKMSDGPSDNRITTLAGDFNATKCRGETSDYYNNCRRTILWKRMMELDFSEAIYAGEYGELRKKIIDFVFTSGSVSDVFWDWGNRAFAGYSDHGVVAALLEEEDTTAPYAPGGLTGDLKVDGSAGLLVKKTRYGGWDGGSGWKYWLIYRRYDTEGTWELIAHTRKFRFIDDELTLNDDEVVRYRVAAVDRAGNVSEFTDPIKLRK